VTVKATAKPLVGAAGRQLRFSGAGWCTTNSAEQASSRLLANFPRLGSPHWPAASSFPSSSELGGGALENDNLDGIAGRRRRVGLLAATPAVPRNKDDNDPASESDGSLSSSNYSALDEKVVPEDKGTYDFVVVGYGAAGKAAVRTLRGQCPNAAIAVVDPLLRQQDNLDESDSVHFYRSRTTGLDPRSRRVEFAVDPYESKANEPQKKQRCRYRYAVLIATGARSAPPPTYLVDGAASDRVLELRPTVVPHERQERQIRGPELVREHVVRAARAGERVGILGSGWEAVDLAVGAAAANKRKTWKPLLVSGSSSPLCHVLPAYLSSSVSKRLRSKVEVLDRTLIRYVSHVDGVPTDADVDSSGKGGARCGSLSSSSSSVRPLQLYTAKSYDFLDSGMDTLDWIVLAQDTRGSRGSAAVPTSDIPVNLQESGNGRSWYQTWSMLANTTSAESGLSALACYKDDGRIVVNSEMCACTGVFAVGSAAKHPNPLTGHADVAGFGAEDAVAAGRIAALNMSQQYHAATRGGLFARQHDDPVKDAPLTKDPVPVFRTDVLAHSNGRKSYLQSIGINALCIGNCDSERFLTHGVWWTNQAAQRRLLSELDSEGNPIRRRRTVRDSLKPVYGIGVVFYLDKTYKLQGVMTWGLPFTYSKSRQLNQQLVQQVKHILRSNGSFRHGIQSETDHIRLTNYLTRQSQLLVAMAFAGYAIGEANASPEVESSSPASLRGSDTTSSEETGRAHRLDGELDRYPRPLHRFTEARPPGVRSVGVLKRKQGDGHGVLGEDLFARSDAANDWIAASTRAFRMASRRRSTRSQTFSSSDSSNRTKQQEAAERQQQHFRDWAEWEARERIWDDNEQRARPAKEEPLWIRKGDEMRSTSAKEKLMAAYNSAIWAGTGKEQ